MAYPQSLDPTAPAGTDTPRSGDDQIRALKQLLADLFGLPVAPTAISAAIGSTTSGGKLTLSNADWQGDLGIKTATTAQAITFGTLTELTTIAAAATTDTAIEIPLDAVVFAVSARVTVLIPTAATFTVIGTTTSTQFDVAGGVLVAAGTTDKGTRNCPYKNGAAQTIRITPNLTPGTNTGRVRVSIHYYFVTPPTS